VYYFLQKDNERASKCLDKVLKLEPNFEQAFLLQFYLTSSLEARISLIDRFMEINKNVAVTYFFKGLIMQ
jgi:tetratricopeptide (TPR) repeat protein